MAPEELARLLSRLLKRGQKRPVLRQSGPTRMQVVAGLLYGKNSFLWFGVLLLRGDAQTGGVEQETPNEAKKNSQNVKHFSLKDFAGF